MQIPLLVFLREGIFLCGYFSQILAWADPLLYAGYGKIFQRGNVHQEGSETMKQDYTPLDQDTLTRLVYTHDDEITELTQKMLLLIDRIKQVESELNGKI